MKNLSLALAFCLAAVTPTDTLTFDVVGIDCPACAPPIVKALNALGGVKNARVDTRAKTATVEVPAGFDRQKVREALSNAGFEAVFPGEQRREIEPLPQEVVKTLDIVTFTDGRRVDFARIVAPGKTTIVDFYADWCGPCRVLEARLQHLMQKEESRPSARQHRQVGQRRGQAGRRVERQGAAVHPGL